MSSFTQPLRFENTDKWSHGRRKFRILKGFRYYIGVECSNLWIDVEEGEETDLGSIPRIVWPWISPDSPWSSTWAVHDKCYRLAQLSRLMSDLIMWEASGLPQWIENDDGTRRQVWMPLEQRIAVYRSVRFGGWRTYRKYAAEAALKK
jgi:hypothetical protein